MWFLLLTNLIIHEYYYRYREKRKQIKNQLIDIGNYTEAKTQLENIVVEHQSKFPDSDTRKDFNYGEKIMMNHALAHLNVVIDKDDPEFQEVDENLIPTLIRYQSDNVKDALLQNPKSDYNNNNNS